jgi:hypothetical protein
MLTKSNSPEAFDPDDIIGKIAPIGQSSEYLTVLLYGRAGTGKTTLLATFPKPLLLIDIKEQGTASVRAVPGIESVSISHWDEYESLFHFLKRKGKKYKTIGSDPISGLQRLGIDKAREQTKKLEGDLLSRKDWGQVSGGMTTWLGHYRDLVAQGHHIVFTAHERTTTGEDSPEEQIDPSIGPQLMPSVASFICGAVDVLGHTFVRERSIKKDGKKLRKVEYGLRIGPHGYYNTKVRSPRDYTPPDVIVDPSFESIVKVTRGESLISKVKSKI